MSNQPQQEVVDSVTNNSDKSKITTPHQLILQLMLENPNKDIASLIMGYLTPRYLQEGGKLAALMLNRG